MPLGSPAAPILVAAHRSCTHFSPFRGCGAAFHPQSFLEKAHATTWCRLVSPFLKFRLPRALLGSCRLSHGCGPVCLCPCTQAGWAGGSRGSGGMPGRVRAPPSAQLPCCQMSISRRCALPPLIPCLPGAHVCLTLFSNTRLGKCFLKGPESRHSKLCCPHLLCHDHPALPSCRRSSPRQRRQ